MTALTMPARPEEDASLRPVPWRRMAWITWRQHRIALAGVAALLGAVAVWLWIAGLHLHHVYAAATACNPASPACADLISSFNDMNHVLIGGYVLQAVPALIGAFAGAPVLARELETGTFLYAWTQGFGRWRWTLAKLVPLAVERVAGIDIGKAEIMVTIRVPSDTRRGRRQQETRAFRATRAGLLALADWLRCWQVTKVGMEATSDYWKPVYFLLEREGFDCVLYHASQVKALPGRPKTDLLDSAWLARITERGSLPGSFVPPEDIRRLRTHTRYRRHLTQARTAEKARCEKLLEDAHLKLSSVITDIHGVSGREMLTAIIAGQRDPKVLAQMARTRMRSKIRQLEEALDCSFFTEQHAFILQMMLANIDHLTAQISELSAKIDELCQPYERQIAQLDAIPGFGIITAQDILGEIGVDMSVFPTAGHLCSWARQAPGVRESAGKRKGKNATGRGNPYLGGALGEAAANAGRTQTFLGTKYRRLIRHMPKKKAQGAISRTQLVIAHALLSDPSAAYEDLGTDYYERRADIRRRARSHVRDLERLGYKVTIEAINPDTGELLPIAS